jgi:Putative threonine efflux protein
MVETWTAFCAASILLILLPSPLAALVARFALQRGRSTAFFTVPGACLGLAAALAVASIPVVLLAVVLPQAIEPLAWLGLAYLMLYILWSFQEPSIRGPISANDNLPARQPVEVFAYLLATALGTGRYVAVLAALLLQFAGTVSGDPGMMIQMQAGFLLVAAFGFMIHVVSPRSILGRLRRRNMPGPASHKLRTRFIARRAVSAGYRRIAA